jgi:hypothetical protein
MKQLSVTARLVLCLVAALGACVYLVVADLGINAGLIHYGVQVGHVEVGRMTDAEATQTIEDAGAEMAATPIVFTADGLSTYSWLPEELGWQPRATLMTERALKVGRRRVLTQSISERVASYFGGVTLRWERPRGWRVNRAVEDVAADAALMGLDVDEAKMARMIRHAARTWPRKNSYQIPLT